MNLSQSLDWGTAQLGDGPHSDRARRDAETLLLHHIGKNKAWLIAHGDEEFAGCPAIGYAGLIERRRNGEPIQYITGECEFYGLPFRVTPDVLIPRPETEHLVEKVIELAGAPHKRVDPDMGAPGLDSETWETNHSTQNPGTSSRKASGQQTLSGAPSIPRTLRNGWETRNPAPPLRILDAGTGSGAIAGAPSIPRILRNGWETRNPAPPLRILDVGTGSGAIAIAIASQLPKSEITAIDISESALSVARENAKNNGVAIRFLQGDLLAPVAGERFEIIVSNPPYVPNTERALIAVEVREHEPAVALWGGADGLEIYRRLIPAAYAALVPGGFIAMEMGFNQASDVQSILTAADFVNIEISADLQGIPRVISARHP